QKGKQATRSKYHVSRGKFPGADFPLAIVQFDHTPLDIILVDREHRVAIGRPYLTLAIDVCSRMVYGYFLSLQKPSYVSVAMCLLAGINSKDNLLERFSLDAEDWPVFGLPACIHVDNGKEFRSTHLEDFCKEYQINLEYRPIRTPQYGGHIERLFGTINEQCHQLEGTTFSSVYHKGDYQSEKYANLTLDELEEYLVNTILEYHLEVHDGVSMPPKRCWEREVLDGLVSPYIPTDQTRMVIDLLPFKKRTIQKEGVGMFDLHYTSDVLQNIHFAQKQEKQMYKVKYDPRDISKVYLLNPAQNRYEVLFLTDRRIGPISKIELDQIKRVIKVENERFDKSNLARYKDRKQGIIDRAKANKFESKRQRRIHEQISRGAEQAEKLHPGRKTKLPDLPATVPEVDLAAIKFDDLD
ncbi:MAG TPA: transposase family protein, partial [Anaerolineales bacterium]|nr:transposase family protein [Anaerolineales bacterium]